MTRTKPMPPKLAARTALLTGALAFAAWSSGFGTPINASQAKPATTADQHHDDHEHVAETQHDAGHAHADTAGLTNPVKSTPASIAAGKALFEKQCVSCHGATGTGDGKSGAKLTPPPADLTDATWKHGASDGEIYTLIKDGSKNTAMKGFASRMTAQELWSVVNYIRSLQVH